MNRRKNKSRKRPRRRQTLLVPNPNPLQKRKKEDGRPKGTYKIYPFEQTKLGFMLKYEVPEVYDLILTLTPTTKRKAPPVEIIRTVCAASPDPSLRKAKFFRWLEEYERSGVMCGRPTILTPKKMVFYHVLRKHKLERLQREMEEANALTDTSGNNFNSIEQ